MQLNSRNQSTIRSQTQSNQFSTSVLAGTRQMAPKSNEKSLIIDQDAKHFYTSAFVQSSRDISRMNQLQQSASSRKAKKINKSEIQDPQIIASGKTNCENEINQENIKVVSEYLDYDSPATVRRQQASPLRESKGQSNTQQQQPSWLEQSMSSLLKAKAKYHEAQLYLQMSESKCGAENSIPRTRPLSSVNSQAMLRSSSSYKLNNSKLESCATNKNKAPASRNSNIPTNSHTYSNSTLSTSFAVDNRSTSTNRRSLAGNAYTAAAAQQTAEAKADLINNGLRDKSHIISSKTEQQSVKLAEKKQIQGAIIRIKKDIIQMQKQATLVKNSNKQIESDFVSISKLIVTKKDKSSAMQKEIAKLKKEIKLVEKDVEQLKHNKVELETEIQAEEELTVSVQELVGAYRKNIVEVRKEKEKLQIAVKSSIKVLEVLAKRRNVMDGDSTKLYLDFKDALAQDRQIIIDPYN